MDLPCAIDVFTQGFAMTRSRTHPYLVRRVSGLWVMQDAPRKSAKQHQRRREVIALDADPAKVVKTARAGGDDGFVICAFHDGHGRREALEEAYKRLGFRYITHEPMFVRKLPPAPRGRTPLPVARVTDLATARLIAKAARRRQIDEADLADDDAAVRLFAAKADGKPVGWVSSIRTRPGASWVSNLYVDPAHRKLGIGASLMRCMLRDDFSRGIHWSVLLASQAGARVYRKLGYDQIATLQMFTPIPRDGDRKAVKAQRESKDRK